MTNAVTAAPTMLNLGCGTKVCSDPRWDNIDFSFLLRVRRNPVLRTLSPLFVRGKRMERMRSLPPNIRVHNLARGIPYGNESVDVVYHSHLFEHLDRPVGDVFLREIHRVLRPGGILRIAVPDLELACRNYLQHLDECAAGSGDDARHDDYVDRIIGQCVRREAVGSTRQSPLRRRIENMVFGDARKRAETHQWMWDRINLGEAMRRAGFREPIVQKFDTSRIDGWIDFGLELRDGKEYMPHSLYMEAVR